LDDGIDMAGDGGEDSALDEPERMVVDPSVSFSVHLTMYEKLSWRQYSQQVPNGWPSYDSHPLATSPSHWRHIHQFVADYQMGINELHDRLGPEAQSLFGTIADKLSVERDDEIPEMLNVLEPAIVAYTGMPLSSVSKLSHAVSFVAAMSFRSLAPKNNASKVRRPAVEH
jgi:hypothetical protein